MPNWKLNLFGFPHLAASGTTVELPRRKAVALLAYLATAGPGNEATVHGRETLATLLWPDNDPTQGRANLSRVLADIKKQLGSDWSLADRQTVALNLRAGWWIDVLAFQELIASVKAHAHQDDQGCNSCLTMLEDAVHLYRDEFMVGFAISGGLAFDEWQFYQAETLKRQFAGSLNKLIHWYAIRGAYDRGIAHARRWLAQDNLHEPAHRALMRLLAWSGQGVNALRQFDECQRLLADELGVRPDDETTALAELIRKRRLEKPAGSMEVEIGATQQGSTRPATGASLAGGKYEIREFIGSGGHGEVFLAHEIGGDRPVVIKRLKPEVARDHPELVERFAREGVLLQRLNHPNIIRILDFFEDKGRPAIVLEYITGGSLRERLKHEQPLPVEAILNISLEVADALSRIHHLGIVHRDLKPDNILLTEDLTPKLTDFGIAGLVGKDVRLTQTGTFVGSPAYVSPELLRGQEADARSDIWSFGIMIYELLAGRLPFGEQNIGALLGSILNDQPAKLADFRYGAPPGLVSLVERILEKEPGRRPGSMRQIAAEIEALRAGEELPMTFAPAATTGPPQPAFMADDAEFIRATPPVFVARQRELAWLEGQLEGALEGKGRVLFIKGEAGRGKSSLLNAFTGLAQKKSDQLVVARGSCDAFAGAGDPFMPVRDVMSMLAGDVEARWASGVIDREQARRLWELWPLTAKAVARDGHDLVDILLSPANVERLAWALPAGQAEHLQDSPHSHHQPYTGGSELDPAQIFQEFTQVIHILAGHRPLLLLLDDVQWADSASINLLFHLGRRIEHHPVLIICAYRPSEVALGSSSVSGRHLLEPVLHELKRQYGQIELDLEGTEPDEGRAFVDALIDCEANVLSDDFRQGLADLTKGHPLFTVELLRDLQERGHLVQDQDGVWLESSAMSWQALPARVEAIIAQRIGRVDEELRELLAIASVEGEVFTVQVVALVTGLPERQVIHRISRDLEGRHRLVREHEEVMTTDRPLQRYRFGHALFQGYLYNSLSRGERRLLHGAVAEALEELYAGRAGEVVSQLAEHTYLAGEITRSIEYARQAAARAEANFAYDQSISFLDRALSLLRPGQSRATRLALLEKLADVYNLQGKRPEAMAILTEAVGLWKSLPEAEVMDAIRLHRKVGQTVSNMTWYADRQRHEAIGRSSLEEGLALSRGRPAHPEIVSLLTILSQFNWLIGVSADWEAAEQYAEEAVQMAGQMDDPLVLSRALDALATVYGVRGLFRERVEVSLRRLELSDDPRLEHRRERARINAQTGLALMLVGEYRQAMAHLQDAEQLAAETRAVDHQFRSLRYQTKCLIQLDQWDEAQAMDRRWRELAGQYANFEERVGPTCYMIALIASVHALRGEYETAEALRVESVDMMVAADGPPEGWERNNLY